MATKKFIIEVEEGHTECMKCPLRVTSEICSNVKCTKFNLATMKIDDYDKYEENEGKALLYAVDKTVERTKKEMIKKAKKYLQEKLYTTPIFEYDEDEEPIMYVCASCCDSVEEFISDFIKAMEEQ